MVCIHCGLWVRVKGTCCHLCCSCCASCCCCLSSFSYCCPATQQDWLGGIWDSGDLPCILKSTMNIIHHLVATSPLVMWHLDSMMWAVNFIGRWPFPFISVARARLSSAPAQLCPKRRVWELGAELSCRNDGSNSGTAAQVTVS